MVQHGILLSGLYYFVLLTVEKMWLGKWIEKMPKLVSHIYALFFINVQGNNLTFEWAGNII